ncbi:hypothetical protein HTVC024P_gp06 [Pelagibacter phage HTVC024P]|nr:hypothetical protein HTVC024P_gp06 [Pelagibacter phage HTVC024P]
MAKNKLYGIKKIYGEISWGEFGVFKMDFQDFSNAIYNRWSNGKKPKKRDIQKLLQTCDKFIKLNKHIKR